MQRSRLALLCLFVGLPSAACTGGPISDFPRGSSDNGDDLGEGSASDGDQGGDGDGDGDGTGDGSESPGAGDPDDGASGGADGGVPPEAGDAGVDGGALACSHASEAQADGCYGVYCATTLSSLASLTAATAACGEAAELALVCEGALPRTVASCTTQAVAAPDRTAAITACVRLDGALSAVSDDCLGCYAVEADCALTNCLEACLGGVPGACDACRAESCAEAFATCSGLPAP